MFRRTEGGEGPKLEPNTSTVQPPRAGQDPEDPALPAVDPATHHATGPRPGNQQAAATRQQAAYTSPWASCTRMITIPSTTLRPPRP